MLKHKSKHGWEHEIHFWYYKDELLCSACGDKLDTEELSKRYTDFELCVMSAGAIMRSFQ